MKPEIATSPPGRGPKVRNAVLAATLTELTETGYTALTVENVARRAGVHKTTVYRRWKDREALVVDTLTEHIAADIAIPDTGSIDTDLPLLAAELQDWLTGPVGRAVMAAMLSDAIRVPEIAQARERIFADRLRRAAPVITRAVNRGELPTGTDPAEVVKTMAASIYFRVLVTGEPTTDASARRAAHIALTTARSGPLPK